MPPLYPPPAAPVGVFTSVANGLAPASGGGTTNFLRADATWQPASGATPNDVVFGPGLDGSATISGDTTLTRDMFYTSLTVDAGVNLNTGGFRVFVSGTLTNNGTIRNNGANASGGSGGAGGASGSLAGGTAGGNSSAGTGTAITTRACPGYHTIATANLRGANGNGLPGDARGRGGGGAGDNGINPGASSGNINSTTALDRGGPSPYSLISGAPDRDGGATGTANSWLWATGGGAGNNTSAGGGGGGMVLVAARIIAGTGSFQARGGNGSGSSGGTNGGGGGGGGGFVMLVYATRSGSTSTSVTGGTGGSGTGGGGNGGAGADGFALLINTSGDGT